MAPRRGSAGLGCRRAGRGVVPDATQLAQGDAQAPVCPRPPVQDDGWPLALRPRHRRAQTRLVPLQRGLFVRPQVHLLQHLPRDLARATPEAVDRLILDTSRYTTAAMQGCSRRHPTTVLGLWQEMHDILSGPDAESYRYPLDDLQRVSTVRHLVEGTLAVTQLS